jgi:hypothetical protein
MNAGGLPGRQRFYFSALAISNPWKNGACFFQGLEKR